jgi:protease-4
MSTRPSVLRKLLRALDVLQRLVAAALLVALLGALAAVAVSAYRARPRVPEGAALVLNPRGVLVEQLSVRPPSRRAAPLLGLSAAPAQVLLRDVQDALRLARDDDRIAALYLDLEDLRGGGMSKLRAVRQALLEFKASGKTIVAYAETLTQRPYYLLAHADEALLHPEGLLVLQGFGGYRPYYREGLERHGIDVHVFRVGEYKTAVEPYLRDDMSPEAREALLDVYGDLWRTWLEDVASARGRRPDQIQGWIETTLEQLRDAGGDLARAALDAGFVDRLARRDEVRQRMIELVGEDEDGQSFRQVSWRTYLAARADDRRPAGRDEGVAVVVAAGEVLDGAHPPGLIGGDSSSRLVRRARRDENAKAVVLRIDSPGGSVFASELIRRECELVRDEGKPLVVSMGSTAASAAYFISSAADEIWAHPTTVTGSIGIFALFPTVPEALERYLGVHLDGAGTTSYTGAFHPGRPLDPRVAEAMQLWIDDAYRDFVGRVAEARGQTWNEVDRIARGRVWSGTDAVELGLVDRLGGLQEAIESAAKRAGLEDGYRVFYVEEEPSLKERILRRILDAASGDEAGTVASPTLATALGSLPADLGRIASWNDPKGLYGHCLCGEEWP